MKNPHLLLLALFLLAANCVFFFVMQYRSMSERERSAFWRENGYECVGGRWRYRDTRDGIGMWGDRCGATQGSSPAPLDTRGAVLR